MFEITEADEQISDRASALALVREKAREVALDEETLGVLGMYEEAARGVGCTAAEIEEALVWGYRMGTFGDWEFTQSQSHNTH